jgi:hypothetical protein
MKAMVVFAAAAILSASITAQETKPVPNDSVRVFVPGCSKGRMFTAGPRTEDHAGSPIPEGMHLRMSGPKAIMTEIKEHEGFMIEITGLMKKGQVGPGGISVGRGVRVTGGSAPTAGSGIPSPGAGQSMIDVEGWRRIPGQCQLR